MTKSFANLHAKRPDRYRRPDEYWRRAAETFGHDAIGYIAAGDPEHAFWSARFAFRCAMILGRRE